MGSPNILSRTQLVCSKQLFYSQSILGNTTVNTTSGYEYITFLLQPFKFSFVQRSNKLPVEQYVKCGRILVLNMCSLAFSGVKFFIVRRTPIFWLALTLRTLRCLNILHMNYFIYTSHHFTPHGRYELNKLASLPIAHCRDVRALGRVFYIDQIENINIKTEMLMNEKLPNQV